MHNNESVRKCVKCTVRTSNIKTNLIMAKAWN